MTTERLEPHHAAARLLTDEEAAALVDRQERMLAKVRERAVSASGGPGMSPPTPETSGAPHGPHRGPEAADAPTPSTGQPTRSANDGSTT